jgi:hypothetical protein
MCICFRDAFTVIKEPVAFLSKEKTGVNIGRPLGNHCQRLTPICVSKINGYSGLFRPHTPQVDYDTGRLVAFI